LEKIELPAIEENFETLMNFLEERVDQSGLNAENLMLLKIAFEEIIINVIHYAYGEGGGPICVLVDFLEDPKRLFIEVRDHGISFNPLERADPDIHVPAEERNIGGLGIFMTKKIMDSVTYRREDGMNILTMIEGITEE